MPEGTGRTRVIKPIEARPLFSDPFFENQWVDGYFHIVGSGNRDRCWNCDAKAWEPHSAIGDDLIYQELARKVWDGRYEVLRAKHRS